MKVPHKAHVALVDGQNFRLLHNEGQIFEPKLVLVEEPSLEATNYSAGVRHQDEPGMNKTETDFEELAHAAAAAEWLNQAAIKGMFDKLIIVADPKSLGEMRRHYHKQLQACLEAELDKAIAAEPLDRVEQVLKSA